MSAEESKCSSRTRAGEEATCSNGKRKHGRRRLRIRCIPRASLKIKLKALCINFGRLFRSALGLMNFKGKYSKKNSWLNCAPNIIIYFL
jgi:hypothetical protein